MSQWLNDGEVLVGQGSGEASPWSSRQRSPRPVQGRGLVTSPTTREAMPGTQQPETMGKARELFVLCDKEGKGFITKRDMQRLEGELPLSPEQLETVFDSLDRESNGFLTPIEFNTGLGGLMRLEETAEQSQGGAEEDKDQIDWTQDPSAMKFLNMLMELGADKLFQDHWELCSLWCELQRDRPELSSVLEDVLVHAVSQLQDSLRERDCLEQALRRRESEHDQVVRSIYEEMESQLKEERDKQLDNVRQWDRGQQLQEELKMREQDLESSLAKQRDMETRVEQLSCEQADTKEQNQELHSLNLELQGQLETSREELQTALSRLNLIQLDAAREQLARQKNVLKVSRNMQKEKDSLLRQLDLLRDMNKRLRDEKDARHSQQRNPNVTKTLQNEDSVIGNYLLQDKPLKRQLSSSNQLDQDTEDMSNSSKRHQPSSGIGCENVEQTEIQRLLSLSPQRVFKVVFLGNSGVGKSSFIQHYCTGHFSSAMTSTFGIDYQMKTVTLGYTTVILQLWDTAGQERFRSITQQYYRKADGILTMYDITNSSSLTAVRGWMDCVQERKCEGAIVMLLGNKLDMADSRREVTTREGQRLAEQHQAVFYECSAKTGHNMQELMSQLAGMLAAQQDQQCEETLLLTEDTTTTGCCR